MTRPGADLQGSLATFAPELLFQMLAMAGASGELTLQHEGHTARIAFLGGQLRFATCDLPSQSRLGEVLVRVGRLDAQQREGAVRIWQRQRGGKRLGAILVERGLLTREELEEFIQRQIKERIVEILRWKSGTFAFVAGARADEDIVLETQLEALLLECLTRLDQENESRRGAQEQTPKHERKHRGDGSAS